MKLNPCYAKIGRYGNTISAQKVPCCCTVKLVGGKSNNKNNSD